MGYRPTGYPRISLRSRFKAIESTGVQFKFKVNIGKEVTLDDLQRDFDAVFCATGAWKQPSLGIKDEELLTSGLEFLTQVNRGLRKIIRQKSPGDWRRQCGRGCSTFSSTSGCYRVTMACLESREEMPALPDEIEQAVQEGIKLMPSWGPSRILKEQWQAIRNGIGTLLSRSLIASINLLPLMIILSRKQ